MNIGFLFPGQGAQYVGMGKELAENFKAADDVFNQANDILGVDLKKIAFEGPESELTLTNNSQPALFVSSVAALAVLREAEIDIVPAAAAGLSLGEFTALHVAGVLNFEESLKLVRLRGTLMQQACDENQGTMASIMGLEEKDVFQIVAEADKVAQVDVANVNCPGQIVVSGTKEGVHKAIELADAKEAKKIVELTVAGAFHSRLMQSAREKLEEALKEVALQTPQFPVYQNVTGQATDDVESIRKLLGEQVTSSVLWEKCLRQMIQNGVTAFIELGAGRVLSGLLKRTERGIPFANVEDLKSLEKTKRFVEELSVNK